MIIPPIGGLGATASLGQAPGIAESSLPSAPTAAGGGQGGFGGALTEAISSLEQTQNSGSNAAQALATGNVSDPESAVVTVEDAQLAMEMASQIRSKATEATQSIFNTQV
jgi:flagellar hook-basal body complex protein FliE